MNMNTLTLTSTIPLALSLTPIPYALTNCRVCNWPTVWLAHSETSCPLSNCSTRQSSGWQSTSQSSGRWSLEACMPHEAWRDARSQRHWHDMLSDRSIKIDISGWGTREETPRISSPWRLYQRMSVLMWSSEIEVDNWMLHILWWSVSNYPDVDVVVDAGLVRGVHVGSVCDGNECEIGGWMWYERV